jgi:hypothetical protein
MSFGDWRILSLLSLSGRDGHSVNYLAKFEPTWLLRYNSAVQGARMGAWISLRGLVSNRDTVAC